jgi:catechol 2,3-dioxygenase-like lactoylglutathione lyase family enzyme
MFMSEKSGIKVTDIAYGRLQSPDLDAMEEFLTEFGLIKVERTATALYMRGTDPVHHIHITEKGDPKFLGLAFHARDMSDLRRAAELPGASGIEHIDEPGGGQRVRLVEPNGYTIEIVDDLEPVAPIKIERLPMNSGDEPLRRKGVLMRHPKGPTPVKRIAHGVMGSPKVVETVQWFRDVLGMIGSDDIYVGDPKNIIGSFNRCDRGDEYVDHHTFFCLNQPHAGLNHLSFEVPDIDAVLADHHYLKSLNKYEHMWGVGRHLLGSQVYDYWADPWGRVHEHWADSDRINASAGYYIWPPEQSLVSQWGEDVPERMMTRCCP